MNVQQPTNADNKELRSGSPDKNNEFVIKLRNNEALVLFEFLARFNGENIKKGNSFFEDSAEEKVLWVLESILEKQIDVVFCKDYLGYVQTARAEVREKYGD